jgi:hypothetical protein
MLQVEDTVGVRVHNTSMESDAAKEALCKVALAVYRYTGRNTIIKNPAGAAQTLQDIVFHGFGTHMLLTKCEDVCAALVCVSGSSTNSYTWQSMDEWCKFIIQNCSVTSDTLAKLTYQDIMQTTPHIRNIMLQGLRYAFVELSEIPVEFDKEAPRRLTVVEAVRDRNSPSRSRVAFAIRLAIKNYQDDISDLDDDDLDGLQYAAWPITLVELPYESDPSLKPLIAVTRWDIDELRDGAGKDDLGAIAKWFYMNMQWMGWIIPQLVLNYRGPRGPELNRVIEKLGKLAYSIQLNMSPFVVYSRAFMLVHDMLISHGGYVPPRWLDARVAKPKNIGWTPRLQNMLQTLRVRRLDDLETVMAIVKLIDNIPPHRYVFYAVRYLMMLQHDTPILPADVPQFKQKHVSQRIDDEAATLLTMEGSTVPTEWQCSAYVAACRLYTMLAHIKLPWAELEGAMYTTCVQVLARDLIFPCLRIISLTSHLSKPAFIHDEGVSLKTLLAATEGCGRQLRGKPNRFVSPYIPLDVTAIVAYETDQARCAIDPTRQPDPNKPRPRDMTHITGAAGAASAASAAGGAGAASAASAAGGAGAASAASAASAAGGAGAASAASAIAARAAAGVRSAAEIASFGASTRNVAAAAGLYRHPPPAPQEVFNVLPAASAAGGANLVFMDSTTPKDVVKSARDAARRRFRAQREAAAASAASRAAQVRREIQARESGKRVREQFIAQSNAEPKRLKRTHFDPSRDITPSNVCSYFTWCWDTYQRSSQLQTLVEYLCIRGVVLNVCDDFTTQAFGASQDPYVKSMLMCAALIMRTIVAAQPNFVPDVEFVHLSKDQQYMTIAVFRERVVRRTSSLKWDADIDPKGDCVCGAPLFGTPGKRPVFLKLCKHIVHAECCYIFIGHYRPELFKSECPLCKEGAVARLCSKSSFSTTNVELKYPHAAYRQRVAWEYVPRLDARSGTVTRSKAATASAISSAAAAAVAAATRATRSMHDAGQAHDSVVARELTKKKFIKQIQQTNAIWGLQGQPNPNISLERAEREFNVRYAEYAESPVPLELRLKDLIYMHAKDNCDSSPPKHDLDSIWPRPWARPVAAGGGDVAAGGGDVAADGGDVAAGGGDVAAGGGDVAAGSGDVATQEVMLLLKKCTLKF